MVPISVGMMERTRFAMKRAASTNATSNSQIPRPRGTRSRSKRITRGRQMYAIKLLTTTGTMRLRSFQNRYEARSATAAATTDLKSVPAGTKSLRGFTVPDPFLIEILTLQNNLESHGDNVG